MKEDWQNFLREEGAVYAQGEAHDFGNPAAERRAAREGDILVDLSHLSLIHASGADAEPFLNGQLTNDVGALGSGQSQLSAWCSPKGRMLAVFRVLPYEEGYLLQLPASLHDDVSRRLRMYVLRSKVVLAPADERFVRLGVAGARAPALLEAALGAAPEGDNAVVVSDGTLVLRLQGIHPRYEVLVPPAAAPGLWNALKREATPAGSEAWTWHDIMAGIPIVLPPTSDAIIPQMANLDLLDGISFNKGCYTGQEIVARLHYRGRLKQRMYRAHVDAEAVPPPGEPVYAASAPNQSAGTIVIAAPGAEGGHDLLAVIHCDRVEGDELRLGRADGPRLTIEPLPYSVPAE